jgi:phytoene/squalene synthetase
MDDSQLDSCLVRLAQKRVCQSNPTVFNLSRLLYDRRSFSYFLLGYAYFRWLDDCIDAPGASSEAIQAVIARQRDLLNSLYQGKKSSMSVREDYEEMLVQILRYDCSHNYLLRTFVMDMFAALEFDARRRYHACSQGELDAYSLALGRSYTNVLQVFVDPKNPTSLNSLAHQAGFAAHQVHMLRDLYIDLALGYCNVSREDLDKFHWKVEDLPETDIHPWVVKTASKAFHAFQQGLQEIACISNPRCRLLGYATSAHYMLILKKLQSNGYHLTSLSPASKVAEGRGLAWALRATFNPRVISKFLYAPKQFSTT